MASNILISNMIIILFVFDFGNKPIATKITKMTKSLTSKLGIPKPRPRTDFLGLGNPRSNENRGRGSRLCGNLEFLTASKYCGSGLKIDSVVVVVVVILVIVIFMQSLTLTSTA